MKARHRLSTGVLGAMLLAAATACEPAEQEALGPADGRDLAPVDTGRVAVGDLAPDFTLASFDRGPVTLSDYRGAREVILVFYRGHW